MVSQITRHVRLCAGARKLRRSDWKHFL